MKTQLISSPRLLSDRELIDQVKQLACHERQATARLVAHLAELEERRLHVAEGCASLFSYCTEVLHLSEHAAYNRIEAARAARKFPFVLEKLADGSVNLTAVRRLAPHLTEENHRAVLSEATHKARERIEEIVARLRPSEAVRSTVRKLPALRANSNDSSEATSLNFDGMVNENCGVAVRSSDVAQSELSTAAGSVSADVPIGNSPSVTKEPRLARVAPLAPDLYKVTFTADGETHRLLQQARELLRHQVPDGDAAAVIGLALKLLVQKLKQQKFGDLARATRAVAGAESSARALDSSARALDSSAAADGMSRPAQEHRPLENDRRPAGTSQAARQPQRRSNPRYIPTEVRREVWKRDEGRCAFVARTGRRCSERGRLEFHHVRPFALGGPATVANIQLRCRTHNQHEAERCFGIRVSRKALVSKRVENVTFAWP